MLPAGIAEIGLTLWLIIVGVNASKYTSGGHGVRKNLRLGGKEHPRHFARGKCPPVHRPRTP